MMKVMYNVSIANIIYISEILSILSLRLGIRKACPLPFLFNITLKGHPVQIKQKKK